VGETGVSLETRGKAQYFDAEYSEAIELYEQAFSAYRSEDDVLGAARSARTVWWLRANIYGDWAVANGWMQRALTVLAPAREGSQEWGWVLVARARGGQGLEEQRRLLLEAGDIARKSGDSDLEVEAISFLGVMLVLSGFSEEGMVYIDEALAVVCAGDAQELATVEGVFCGLFATCERTYDIVRAEQWLRAADSLARQRPNSAIAAFCRVHYGGILTAAGRWAEAETELTTAARIFEGGYLAARPAALCRLADLRVRQGRFEEAGQLLEGLDQHFDATRPLAALHLARGDVALAQDVLQRALQSEMEDAFEGPLRALLVDVHLATGSLDAAQAAASRLIELAANQSGHYLKAVAALASGKMCVASGTGDARACLHEALSTFAHAQLPIELAQTRLELAKAVAGEQPEVAVAEATAALESFERLQSERDADAAAALLRTLGAPGRSGPRGRAGLTKRETEVLELLGHGLTNAEIGDRLFISPKTVEHHVGKVLAKLGLRSRAQAAAHAVRTPDQRIGG
jgi:DNA-binding CsgD family transcriptional regulator